MQAVLDAPGISPVDRVDTLLATLKDQGEPAARRPQVLRGGLTGFVRAGESATEFSPSSQGRLLVLEGIRGVLVEETRQALAHASPNDFSRALLALGWRHWGLWSAALRYADDLERTFNLPPSKLLASASAGWAHMGETVDEWLPLIPASARRDIRSVAFFLSSLLGLHEVQVAVVGTGAVGAEFARALVTMYDTPVQHVHPDLIQFLSASQVLSVGGRHGGVSDGILRAVSGWLWDIIKKAGKSIDKGQELRLARERAADLERLAARAEASSEPRSKAREEFRQAVSRDYDALKADLTAWREHLEVREEWAVTLADGLEETSS